LFKVKIKTYTYTYDNTSNITSDNNKNYTYDQLYRLTQTTNTNNETLENFTYDSMWNRLTNYNAKVWSWATYEYTNNNLNQYTTQTWSIQNYEEQEIIEEIQTETQTESGTIYGTWTQITYTWSLVTTTTNTNYTYDDNWNLTNDWINTYIYDYKNRLLKVQNQTWTIVEFNYDVLGRRYQKNTAQKTINYIYSNQSVLTEYKTENWETTQRDYIYWNWWVDDVVAYIENWNTYYIHKDNLWSTIWITDNSWTILTSYEYDSFWNVTQTWTDLEYTRLFTWREYDSEIWLYYNRARYYNPNLGRFISRDPIDIQDDVNLYAYVGNNPVGYMDLMGLEKVLIIGFNWLDISTNSLQVTDGYNIWRSSIWEIMRDTQGTFNNVNSDWIKPYSQNVDFKLYEYLGVRSAESYILANKDKYNKIIILWHSEWADSAVELANKLWENNVNVDLLVTIDLQAFFDTNKVESNTKIAYNFYQSNGVLNWKDFSPINFNWDLLTKDKSNTNTYIVNMQVDSYCNLHSCNNGEENKELWHRALDDALKPLLKDVFKNFILK